MKVNEEAKKKKGEEPKLVKIEIQKKESYFYLGPTIKRGVLEKGSVFRGKVPKGVIELKKEFPLIGALIVGKKDYINSCKEMQKKGSKLQIIYKKILEGGK